MYDFLHGLILSVICSTGFLSVYTLMEISRSLKVLNHLTKENNMMLRAMMMPPQQTETYRQLD